MVGLALYFDNFIMDYLKGVELNTTAGKNPQPDSLSSP